MLTMVVVVFSGCKSKQSTAGNYTYKTECLGNSLDGSQTVKAWGTGRDQGEAIEQAKKNALNDFLFNGIIEGKSVCEVRPIVSELNARTKYNTYFNAFFAEKSDYNKFVTIDENKSSYQVIKARESITYGIVMKFQSAALKQKMLTDGIIK